VPCLLRTPPAIHTWRQPLKSCTREESLVNKTGSPDYIAIREALVNQFIHQDYTDQTACAWCSPTLGTR